MQEITEKARQIRDVIRYLKFFKKAVIVIYIDDEVINSPLLTSHIHDIALIHDAGLKIIIVPGARKRINEILSSSQIGWTIEDGIRITSEESVPLIKMAAFDVSNIIMTELAGENISSVIGNWVKARGKGIINGIDYGSSGDIDKIQIDTINTILENGHIPIFPCIGWSAVGKPYNISSINLAEQIAEELHADKLFYILPDFSITDFVLPQGINITPEGNIPAMNVNELSTLLTANTTSSSVPKSYLNLFKTALAACKKGVSRVHILDGKTDGIIPCEIFSAIGSGTMIYNDEYGGIRPMTREDISSVLSLMKPYIEEGILLPRTNVTLLENLNDYIVYEVDGGIHACAALHIYENNQAEIAGVSVDESYSNMGVGPKMISYLITKATEKKLKSVFVLTTKSADWFEKLGFIKDDINTIPQERKNIWTPSRNSKVLRRKI